MNYKRTIPGRQFNGGAARLPQGSRRVNATMNEETFDELKRFAEAGHDTLSGAVVLLVKEALAARRGRAA